MKIQLIHPPNDETYTGSVDYSRTHIPIGLEVLAKSIELYFKANKRNVDIEILDGNQLSIKKIISKLNADVVGVSDLFSNHKNALAILKHAKYQNHASTFMGGINATNDYKRIKQNRKFIDYVLRGNPEDVLPGIINGKEYKPNKIYGSKHNIIFDLSHSKISEYDKKRYIPISMTRGCEKAKKSGRCSFCSIKGNYSVMNTKQAWEQIRVLSEYGFRKFRETGDNFDPVFYQSLLDNRPTEFSDIEFHIYASADLITEHNIELMQRMNITQIFIGVDSYNDNILKIANKGFRINDVDKALRIIPKDISKDITLMFGFPGETTSTLENNYKFFCDITDRYNNINLGFNKVLPLVGTGFYRQLIKNGVKQKTDIVDYKYLFEKQLELFTNLKLKDIEMYEKRMMSHAFGGFSF